MDTGRSAVLCVVEAGELASEVRALIKWYRLPPVTGGAVDVGEHGGAVPVVEPNGDRSVVRSNRRDDDLESIVVVERPCGLVCTDKPLEGRASLMPEPRLRVEVVDRDERWFSAFAKRTPVVAADTFGDVLAVRGVDRPRFCEDGRQRDQVN